MSTKPTDPSSRLERALATWLEHVESGSRDDAALLAAHPELRDLLEPMLGERAAAATGRRVVGDFEIRAELGRGGMGVVHEAWQRSLGRRVALKILAPALTADSAAIARFRREAAAAAKLRHPNIVEVHGVGHDGDLHWFAMALIDGLPLHRCRERFAEPPAAVQAIAQVLDALQHAHGAGLVHRDVKPANILVRPDGAAVLTDFGLARATTSPTVTAEGGFLGTLDYAAPEQIQAQPVDARADVWSTGVVLAELLTGEHPFSQGTATATLHAILTAEPRGLAALRARDADLAAIVGRALEKDPARRYASAVAFLADLRAWQQGMAVAARLPSLRERMSRWARREPWRAAAAGLLVVGVPLLATVGGYLWANAPRIAAAERAERDVQRERALTAAWVASNDERYAEGLQALEPWTADPTDLEVRYAQASLSMWVDRANATAPLAPFVGTRIHDLVSLLLANAGRDLPFRFDTVTADTMLECAALGELAAEQVRSHHRSPSFYRDAAKWYGRAVALSPQPRAWLLLQWGIAASRAGDQVSLATALAAYEHHFPGTRGLALMYAYAANEVPIDRGLEMLSGPELETDPRWQIARGQLLGRAGRLDEAIAEFERALARKPGYAVAWRHLARLRRDGKDLEAALAAARRAVELEPAASESHEVFGVIAIALGRFGEARDAFARASEIEPDDWKHQQNLGLALHELRDDAGALAAFERAAALAPSQSEPSACMARSLKRLGREEEALAAEIRSEALADPADWRIRASLALRAIEVGLHGLGRQYAERATRIAPNEDGAWWRLAEACLETASSDPDAPAAAAAAVAKAVALDTSVTPREHALWGRSEALNGNSATAIEHLELALRDPSKLPPISREKAANLLRQLRGP